MDDESSSDCEAGDDYFVIGVVGGWVFYEAVWDGAEVVCDVCHCCDLGEGFLGDHGWFLSRSCGSLGF